MSEQSEILNEIKKLRHEVGELKDVIASLSLLLVQSKVARMPPVIPKKIELPPRPVMPQFPEVLARLALSESVPQTQ